MKNKVILRIAILFIILLIFFVFVSSTVYNSKLPVVTVAALEKTGVTQTTTTEGNLYYKDNKDYLSDDSWLITDVYVNIDNNVKKGDKLFTIDISSYEMQKDLYEFDLIKIDNQIQSIKKEAQTKYTNTQLEELLIQKNLVEKQLKLLLNQYPNDGTVYALDDGVVSFCDIKTNQNVVKKQKCVSVYNDKSDVLVSFSLDIKDSVKFNNIKLITAEFMSVVTDKQGKNNIITETISTQLNTSTVNITNNTMDYTSEKLKTEGTPLISIKPKITISTTNEIFNNVVPLSAVHNDNKGEYIFTINERNSLFGIEYFVKKIYVVIRKENDTVAAITFNELVPFTHVVATTTLPLYENQTVIVR